jgi:hypothetical protein
MTVARIVFATGMSGLAKPVVWAASFAKPKTQVLFAAEAAPTALARISHQDHGSRRRIRVRKRRSGAKSVAIATV